MDRPNVWIVMPAYNAAKTVERTYFDIPEELRRNVLLVDDCSTDDTVEVAKGLGIEVVRHETNKGYGGNQKTCYRTALDAGADIVIMLHPDYQYDARMCDVMVKIIELGTCDMVLGNRIRSRGEALAGGMPKWKYVINRLSTFGENFFLGQGIGDFHSGFRAYSRELLEAIPFEGNDDDFAFDQEFLVQAVAGNFKIGDVPVPVRYFEEASSINFKRSFKYGLSGFAAVMRFLLHRGGVVSDTRFQLNARTPERVGE